MRPDRLAIAAGKTVAVAAILVWSLFPIAFIVMSSLKPGQDIFAVPPKWLFQPTLRHYAELWSGWPTFFSGLLNSAVITVGATVLAVIASTCAGYVYSRDSGRMLNASVLFLIAVRLIPPIVVTLPLFPIVNMLRLNDTHLVLILLYATFFVSLGTVLMRTFIDQIPRELDEAARIDGAGRAGDPASGDRAAGGAGHPGGGGVRGRVLVERIPLRLHLHLDPGQDRADGDFGDDRVHRRRRLGRAFRGLHRAVAAGAGLRRAHEPLSGRRADRRRDQGMNRNQSRRG